MKAEPASFRGILAQPNFARLWYGQIISSLGDRFYLFALLYVVLNIKQGLDAGKDSARVTFCAMLPGLLLAPLYGWIIDRYSRRWVMVYADLARVALVLSLLYFWTAVHNLPAVFVVIFLMGACNGLFIPARQAALPQIVAPQHLVTANALISLIGVIANFVGTPVASVIVSIFGAASSFVLNAMGFIVSAWCVYHIKSDLRPTPHEPVAEEVSTWGGMLEGWRVLREKGELGAIVLVNSAFSFIGAMVIITLLQQIVVSVDLTAFHRIVDVASAFVAHFTPKPPRVDIKPLAFGLLMAAIGLGLGIGVGICGRARHLSRSKALPYLGLFLLGLALIGFSHLRAYGPALLGAGFMGILSSFILIPIEARLQNDVDDARRGRVFALRNLCTTTSFLAGLGVNLNGTLLANLGPAHLIEWTGIGAIVVAVGLAGLNAATLRSFWSARPPSQPT